MLPRGPAPRARRVSARAAAAASRRRSRSAAFTAGSGPRHAELAHAEPTSSGPLGVARQLAADADPAAVALRRRDDRGDQREHRLAHRLEQRRERRVPALGGRVYCERSLVPIEKKSSCGASSSACSAAAGTSIIAPTSIGAVVPTRARAASSSRRASRPRRAW